MSTPNEQADEELYSFMQDVVYEYGRGAEHSKHYTETGFGSSFNTEAFCRERAAQLQVILAQHTKAAVEAVIGEDEPEGEPESLTDLSPIARSIRNKLRAEQRERLAELAAPQQSTSPDGEQR